MDPLIREDLLSLALRHLRLADEADAQGDRVASVRHQRNAWAIIERT